MIINTCLIRDVNLVAYVESAGGICQICKHKYQDATDIREKDPICIYKDPEKIACKACLKKENE